MSYEYRIGKYEVTSAQWAEFFSAAYDRAVGDELPHLQMPAFWGGVLATPTHLENPSARRWTTTPQTAMRPAGSISWRVAAMYCNWLHNDKRTDRAAFLNGAYDVSTFGYSGTTFTDQLAHHPGARYSIPTWDEWLKAAHYDPARLNQDGTRGGWRKYSTTSDELPYYGPPGVRVRADHSIGPDPTGPLAMANAGWNTSDFGASPFQFSLGAYHVTSPWGLYDTAGATKEWTEEVLLVSGQFPFARGFDGSAWATAFGTLDQIHFTAATSPACPRSIWGSVSRPPCPRPGFLRSWASGSAFCRAGDDMEDVMRRKSVVACLAAAKRRPDQLALP